MGWFGVIRGHSRSSAMSSFDRVHATSINFNRNYVSILYCFQDIASYLSQVADIHFPQLHLAPHLGVTPFKFHQDVWYQKTTGPNMTLEVQAT